MVQIEESRAHKRIYATLLFLVLLAGLILRVWNINFDEGLNTHPDERSTTFFRAPAIGWPSSLDEFWDADRSPLNPMWNRIEQIPTNYTYGHFPLYMGILMGKVLVALSPIAGAVGLPA